MRKLILNYCNKFPKILIGDYIVIIITSIAVLILFITLWSTSPAKTLRVRLNDHVYGEYHLKQNKILKINGKLGHSIIHINQGKVRFKHAPCNHQYCVRQGWLNKANQIAVCIPNQMSIELVGDKKPYDSLNY